MDFLREAWTLGWLSFSVLFLSTGFFLFLKMLLEDAQAGTPPEHWLRAGWPLLACGIVSFVLGVLGVVAKLRGVLP
jgi:hypothetical protein